MAKVKAVSDEEIIAAILQHSTIKDAAAALQITARSIYDRMEDRNFRALYMSAKDDILRSAVFSINRKLTQAIDTVVGIMQDDTVNPAIRMQAAQIIINNAGKFAERLARDEYNSRAENKDPFGYEW